MGLVYYNWRYYNALEGRWSEIDKIENYNELNYYSYIKNSSILKFDFLGLKIYYNKKIRAIYEAAVKVYAATKDDYKKQKEKYDKAKGEKKRKLYPREKEFGVRVCCKENQKFYLGEIGGGRVGAIYAINIPSCAPEYTVIAIVHSHGDQALSLSEADIRLSKHGYLAEKNCQ